MTCSAIDELRLAQARRRTYLALFAALAVVLHTLEALLPAPAPWFRLGLANVLAVAVLFLFDARAAWTVTLTRIGLGSLVLGTLFAPAFLLSLAGGVLATALMTGSRTLCGERLGPVGVSALGAAGHATGQMLVAWGLLVRHDGIWLIFPWFFLFSLAAGILTGLAAHLLLEKLRAHPVFAR